MKRKLYIIFLGQVGTMVTYFIPNDNPNEMIHVHHSDQDNIQSPLVTISQSFSHSPSVDIACSVSDPTPKRSTSFQVKKVYNDQLDQPDFCYLQP